MRKLLKNIFESYEFEKKWADKNIEFYSSVNEKKTDFYIINYIDTTNQRLDSTILNKLINQLEEDYISDNEKGENIRGKIKGVFEDETKAARIDKNISSIFPIKFSSLDSLDTFQNIIYAVEESSYFFRRYVLPYTEQQIIEIDNWIENWPDKNISSALSAYANDKDKYKSFSKHENTNDAYELVIRLFAKIPFLQFSFETSDKPISVKQQINSQVSENLTGIHELIEKSSTNIDEYINELKIDINKETIEKEIRDRIMKE